MNDDDTAAHRASHCGGGTKQQLVVNGEKRSKVARHFVVLLQELELVFGHMDSRWKDR